MSVAVVFRVVYDSFSEITLLFLVNAECRSHRAVEMNDAARVLKLTAAGALVNQRKPVHVLLYVGIAYCGHTMFGQPGRSVGKPR
jgi:hypothetical protein